METIIVTLTNTDAGWTWERIGGDGITGKSFRCFPTGSSALYNAYGWELRGDEDKQSNKE